CSDSLVDILKVRGLPSDSDAVQPLIANKSLFFFLNTPSTSIYTLSLHDALPILVTCSKFSVTSLFFDSRQISRLPSGNLARSSGDRKSTRLNSSHVATSYAVFCLKKKTNALYEEKWLNMLGTFVKDWLRYESHFV